MTIYDPIARALGITETIDISNYPSLDYYYELEEIKCTISELATLWNNARVTDGTHNWLKQNGGSEHAKEINRKRIEDGSHNLLKQNGGSERAKENNRKKIENKTHNWLSEEHREATKKIQQDKVRNGTHHFIGCNNHFLEKTNPNNIIITCPHCGKSGAKPGMMRWHFDNCKEAKK